MLLLEYYILVGVFSGLPTSSYLSLMQVFMYYDCFCDLASTQESRAIHSTFGGPLPGT